MSATVPGIDKYPDILKFVLEVFWYWDFNLRLYVREALYHLLEPYPQPFLL
jgi:hypothetical protein